MRRLISTIFLFTLVLLAHGQQTDIIMLKNAEVIRGLITDSIPGKSIQILSLPDSTLRTLNYEDIERIFLKGTDGKNSKKSRVLGQVDSGESTPIFYQAYFRLGFGWEGDSSEDVEPDSFLKADFINSIAIGHIVTFGLGVGARFGLDGSTLVPVFLDIRMAPLSGNVSPMVGLSFGPNFQANQDWEDKGMYMNAEIGIRIGEPYSTQLMIAIGIEEFGYVSTGEVRSIYGNSRTGNTRNSYSGLSLSVIMAF